MQSEGKVDVRAHREAFRLRGGRRAGNRTAEERK